MVSKWSVAYHYWNRENLIPKYALSFEFLQDSEIQLDKKIKTFLFVAVG